MTMAGANRARSNAANTALGHQDEASGMPVRLTGIIQRCIHCPGRGKQRPYNKSKIPR